MDTDIKHVLAEMPLCGSAGRGENKDEYYADKQRYFMLSKLWNPDEGIEWAIRQLPSWK